MQKRHMLALLLLSLLALADCGGNPPPASVSTPLATRPPVPLSVYVVSNYPQPQSGGYDAIYALSASDGSQRWRYDSGMTIQSRPILAHGVLYFFVEEVMYALNAADGRVLWHYQTGQKGTIPLVAQGVVYVSAMDAASHHEQVVALDANTGNVLWRSEVMDQSLALDAVADGVIYLESSTNVAALKAMDGKLLWSQKIESTNFFIEQVASGQVYMNAQAGPHQNFLLALSARDGSMRWRFPQTGGAIISPTLEVANDIVYVVFNDAVSTTVAALTANDGSVRWQQPFQGISVDSWLLDQSSLYLSLSDGSVTTLYSSDGSAKWRAPLFHQGFHFLVAPVDGVGYGGGREGLVAFNTADGSVKWRFPIAPHVLLSVTGVINGTVYLSTTDSSGQTAQDIVYALSANDGSTRWKYAVGGAFEVLAG